MKMLIFKIFMCFDVFCGVLRFWWMTQKSQKFRNLSKMSLNTSKLSYNHPRVTPRWLEAEICQDASSIIWPKFRITLPKSGTPPLGSRGCCRCSPSLLGLSKTHLGSPVHHASSQGTRKCVMMPYGAFGYHQMLQNSTKYLKTPKNLENQHFHDFHDFLLN